MVTTSSWPTLFRLAAPCSRLWVCHTTVNESAIAKANRYLTLHSNQYLKICIGYGSYDRYPYFRPEYKASLGIFLDGILLSRFMGIK